MTLGTPTSGQVTNEIKFVDCCTGAEILFRGSIPVVDGDVYSYIGTSPFIGAGGNLITNSCYTVFNIYLEEGIISTYPPAPTMAVLAAADKVSKCDDPICTPCDPILIDPCFMLIPCDGTNPFVSNNSDFEILINTFVSVDSDLYTGTVYVALLTDNTCSEAIEVIIDEVPADECPLTCYYVDNSNGVLYVDENDILQEISLLDAKPYVKICSKVYPVVDRSSNEYLIVNLGLCDLNDCPTLCFKLTNCENSDSVIYTNSDTIIPYVYGTNNIVRILNREGCWITSELEEGEICDCPVDITVTSSFELCIDCSGYTAYKLTSCTNNDVIYTLFDLEASIGQVVKLDCGCYVVEQINYLPPNPQVINLEDTYTNCVECTRTYYKLADCAGVADPIITYTDLSLYINKVVKIENCTECWEVEETTEHLNAVIVNVILPYDTCEECDVDLPCQCSTITNYSIETKRYKYLDCEYNLIEITLESGQTSDRLCVLRWYPLDYCQCFLFVFTVEESPDVFVSAIVIATANGTTLNGYPVFDICNGPECGTVSFDGTNWVTYDLDGIPLYVLQSSKSSSCPFGTWVGIDGNPIPNTTILSSSCDTACNCIDFTVVETSFSTTYNLTITSYDENLNPVYTSIAGEIIQFNTITGCWDFYDTSAEFPTASLCDIPETCPVGTFVAPSPTTTRYVSSLCTIPSIDPEFVSTDHIQYFGDCKNGVCPPPVFKNNRTVRPGYNTPICSPEKYDMITCRFADIMYKLVLEKRYGITNCCPEEDADWLLKKELIDLQALKDPNYICPACPCACNSGKTYSTCNCGI